MPVVSKGEFTVSRLDDGVSSYLHTAWKMADGTFSSEYPQENLLSDTLPNKWPTLENKRAVGSSISKINDAGNILVTATGGTPYYFAGNYSATQVLSDDFLNRIRGKRLVASANVTFVNQLTVPTDSLGISIYCWDDTGRAWQPENRKSMAGSEIISIDVLIPENIVNILVAVRGYGSFVSGASYEIKKMKLEIVEQGSTPTIYTPAPSEDYTNAYPKYRGEYTDTIEADSTDPSKYTWTAYLGEQGPPTGVISQNTVPSSPYVGMLWQCTGNIAGYINPATYRWNGSAWTIYQFTAQNILAETFTGFVFRGVEFIGSKFVSEFDIPLGAEVGAHAVGQTVIENGEIVTDMVEYWSEGSGDITASYDKHLEYSPANGVYMSYKGRRSNVSQEAQLAPGGLRLKVTGFEGTLTAEVLEQMNNCGKVLWEGAMYLTNNHTVTPSIPISKCLNGWTLVWSRYNPGVGPDDSRFKYTTVPKGHIASFPGKGITEVFIAPASETNNVGVGPATKYFYVTDTTIKGYAANSVSPGNGWCIRMVVAW